MAADPLSIAASILGVSAAGFKIAQGLYNIASSIGSSGEEIRLFASDTDIFSHMLYSLSQTLESSSSNSTSHSPRLLVTTEDAVRLCEQVLLPFERIIKRLIPLLVRLKDSERKLKQLGLRIRWVFREKSKVLFYQRILNSLRSTLTCLLASMDLNLSTNMGVERTELLRIQVENAQGVIKHDVEMPPMRFLESGSSAPTSYPGRAMPEIPSESHGETDDLDDDMFMVRRRDAESSVSRAGHTQYIEDDLESEESFDRQIDEDLRTLPGSSNLSTQALYEDIRSLQRKIIEFARESLEMAEDLPPSYDHSFGSNRGGGVLGTQLLLNTSSNIADRQRLSVLTPYQSPRSGKSDRGLTLVELQEKSQILIEDTLGYFHYVPSTVGGSWEDLKTFIRDCYTYHFIYDTRTAPSYAGPQHILEPCAVQGNTANNSVGRIYTLLHSKTFQTEHGVSMRGDQKLYLKNAFQRAIERDQYRLEDHSGNGTHVLNAFRKENWTKRTWLNAQLLLRFDNPFFNDVKNMQVS